MKKIGIIGGISYKSTLTYYERIMQEYYTFKHDAYFPEVIIYSLSFQKFADFEKQNNLTGYINYLSKGITALQKAGADFIVLAANSPHAQLAALKKKSRKPILSIVEVTTKAVAAARIKKVLLLGIKFTLQAGFYQKQLKHKGITVIVPAKEEQDIINNIIFQELNLGIIKASSRAKILKIINRYKVGGVIIGCTVLPLLIGPKHLKIKLFDTTELHIKAIINKLLK